MDRYLSCLGELTAATVLLLLDAQEVSLLIDRSECYEVVAGDLIAVEEETSAMKAALAALYSKVDDHIAKFGDKGVFVKLTSRSAKDAVFEMKSEKTARFLTKELDSVKWSNVDADLVDDLEMACFYQAANNAMCCRSAEEVFSLFLCSDRIVQDLKRAQVTSSPVQLAIREWQPMSVANEFRGFIAGGRLCALSQYFSFIYFPSLVQSGAVMCKQIHEWYLHNLQQRLVEAGYGDCVCDFVLLQDNRIAVVELNPTGIMTGACCFSWSKDENVLINRAATEPCFRVTEAPQRNMKRRVIVPYWARFIQEYTQRATVDCT